MERRYNITIGMVYTTRRMSIFVSVIGRPKMISITNIPQQITPRLSKKPKTNLSKNLRSLKNKKLHRYPEIMMMKIPMISLNNSIVSKGNLFSPQ
jgi:hypothetical protein